ncbi:MAG: hypothetical protein Q8P92_02945 [Candidatus Daviesbacteria bacterium]|nr:hypothetical protein [Candidatus Daviesbacteria bacterium]
MMPRRSLTSQKGNIALILLIILLVLAGVVFFLISKGIVKNPLQNSSPNSSLGAQIFEKTQNPIQDKIPETNPFAKVNPFKGVYKNPFE